MQELIAGVGAVAEPTHRGTQRNFGGAEDVGRTVEDQKTGTAF
jgi:hypothetical protein